MAAAYIAHWNGDVYDVFAVPHGMSVARAGILCLGSDTLFSRICVGVATHAPYYLAEWEPRYLGPLEVAVALTELGCYATNSPEQKSNNNSIPSYIIEGV